MAVSARSFFSACELRCRLIIDDPACRPEPGPFRRRGAPRPGQDYRSGKDGAVDAVGRRCHRASPLGGGGRRSGFTAHAWSYVRPPRGRRPRSGRSPRRGTNVSPCRAGDPGPDLEERVGSVGGPEPGVPRPIIGIRPEGSPAVRRRECRFDRLQGLREDAARYERPPPRTKQRSVSRRFTQGNVRSKTGPGSSGDRCQRYPFGPAGRGGRPTRTDTGRVGARQEPVQAPAALVSLIRASAAGPEEAGFWPVMRRPSWMT